jgi:hypothetical protein
VTSTPDDDRLVELDDAEGDGVSTGTDDDAATRHDELHAEEPLELDDDHLRGDEPPADTVP